MGISLFLWLGRGKVEIQNQDSHFPTAQNACGAVYTNRLTHPAFSLPSGQDGISRRLAAFFGGHPITPRDPLEGHPGRHNLYDFTISARKSVSIMAELGGDERLIQAHQRPSAKPSRNCCYAGTRVRQAGAHEDRTPVTWSLPFPCSMPRIIFSSASRSPAITTEASPRPRCAGRSRPAREQSPVPFAFARRGIGAVNESLGLSLGEPVPCPDPLLPETGDLAGAWAATGGGGSSGSYRVEHNDCLYYCDYSARSGSIGAVGWRPLHTRTSLGYRPDLLMSIYETSLRSAPKQKDCPVDWQRTDQNS
jgi:TrwC relaxase